MSKIGKSVVALAVAIVLVFIVNAMGDIYNPTRTLEEPVYRAGLEGDAGASAETAAAPEPEADIFTLISQASAEDGAKVFKKCTSCHTIDAGGPNRVGPNLHNVVGAPIASKDGFNYSEAVAGHGGEWTYENLDHWIAAPGDFIPGNKMTFAGIKDTADRAALIKFLMSNTENPPPVPEPAAPAAEQPADAAPAEASGEQAAEAPATAGGGFAAMVAAADPAAGEKAFAACKACHTIEAGGPNRVGPNLHNVAGADIASHDGFKYSEALASMDGAWTTERLDQWLIDPKAFAPGNKMTYAGVKDDEKRAAIVAFLRANTENPPPLEAADAGVAAPGEPSETLQEAVPEPDEAEQNRPAPPVGEAAAEQPAQTQ